MDHHMSVAREKIRDDNEEMSEGYADRMCNSLSLPVYYNELVSHYLKTKGMVMTSKH